MNKRIASIFIALLTGLTPVSVFSEESSHSLDLPSTQIFSKGPNEYKDEVLEITRGRGALIGWYIQANKEENVRVTIEYSCAAELNQAYQLSFDGKDQFWNVTPTEGEKFSRAELGIFKMRAGIPLTMTFSGSTESLRRRMRHGSFPASCPGIVSW